MPKTYDIPAAWLAADLASPAEWIIQLTAEQITDIDRAMRESGCGGDKTGHRNAGAVLSVAE